MVPLVLLGDLGPRLATSELHLLLCEVQVRAFGIENTETCLGQGGIGTLLGGVSTKDEFLGARLKVASTIPYQVLLPKDG